MGNLCRDVQVWSHWRISCRNKLRDGTCIAEKMTVARAGPGLSFSAQRERLLGCLSSLNRSSHCSLL